MTEDRRDDLRATAESIIEDAEALKQVELSKLKLDPGDKAAQGLAQQAERLAGDIVAKAKAERELADDRAND